MDDLISRNFIKSLGGECIAARDSKTHELLPISSIDALPPAQPENDWIPCTKKAHPDTPLRVQVQMDNGWIITAYYQDGEWLSVPDCGEPLLDKWIEAWRELPEPYQECEQDEH